jgi:hypothetical protein
MMERFSHPSGLTLSRAELIYLMELSGTTRIIGVESDPIEGLVANEKQKITAQGEALLRQRGLIGPSLPANDSLAEDFSRLLTAALFPRSVIVIVRELIDIGRQILIFAKHDTLWVLHTFPEENTHRFSAFPIKEQACDLVLDWFPIHKFPPPPNNELPFSIEQEKFDVIRRDLESGNIESATKALGEYLPQETQKQALVSAVAKRTLNGAFALLECDFEKQEIINAHTYGLFAGDNIAWLVSSTTDVDQGSGLLIGRIENEFKDFVYKLFGI